MRYLANEAGAYYSLSAAATTKVICHDREHFKLVNPMSTPPATSKPDKTLPDSEAPLSTPRILRAFTGSLIAGTMAILFYKMLNAIATTFANKPVVSDNVTVINLSAAVRTLVLGVIALGTGVFAMAAIGLLLLGLQMIWQRVNPGELPPSTPESQE